jgi:glycosyltransferase involved in cell wall biosynthesis
LRLCRVVTVPTFFSSALPQQLKQILESGIDVTLVSSAGPELEELARTLSVRCHPISIARQPAPASDLRALWKLTRFFQQERFDIVHSSTPKAGLLAALAGAATRRPIRIHTYTGQVWTEMRGAARGLVREADRLIGRLVTHAYADSHSQRDFLIAEGLVGATKIDVLGAGSISGIDLRRFDPSLSARLRAGKRERLGIPSTALLIVFVGRITRDKGITELVEAFRLLRREHEDIHLLLVGPFESGRDPMTEATLREVAANAAIHAVGFVSQPEEYLAAADIFCLPSYREGFGSVVLEAGAMKLPAVATRVTGLVDGVVDGETGLLVPAKDVGALVRALQSMIESPDLRQRMGEAARKRVVKCFDGAVINRAVVDEYFRLASTLL